MRRTYAFESEGVAEEVKSQLEKVEDVVEKKCDSPEACDKVLEKIEDQKEKFDDALKTMAGAAKDCKDGKCDETEMAAKITPKMAELKEVAKEVGVASEGETVSEEELKNVKDYLEGAEEIVEAKKDELEKGGESSNGDDKDDDDEDDDEDESDEATESFIADSIDEYVMAMESDIFDIAMEGTNVNAITASKDAMAKIKTARKEMKAAAKSGDYKTAEAKANECAGYAEEALAAVRGLDNSVGSAVIGNLAYAVMIAFVAAASGFAGYMTGSAISAGTVKVGKAALKDGAKYAAIAGGTGAGATGGVLAGSAVAKVYQKKGAMNEDGTVDKEKAKLTANDVNLLLAGIRNDLAATARKYKTLASKYASKGSSGGDDAATEAMVDQYFDESMVAMESAMLEAAMEGANIDSITIAKNAIKDIKASAKEMKKAAKAKDYSTAKAKAEEAAGKAAEAAKAIDGLDQSVGSAVIATLISMLVGAVYVTAYTIIYMGGFGATTAGYGAIKSGAKVKDAAKTAATGAKLGVKYGVGLKGAAVAAGAGAGSSVGGILAGSALLKFLKKKSVKPDENGMVKLSDLEVQPNEINLIILSMKSDLRDMEAKYRKLAAKFAKKGGSSESDEGATESDGADGFTGFIAACESMQFGTPSKKESDVPFLFD